MRIDEHFNGRGTTIVETDFVPVHIESGGDWFNRQSKDTQLRLAGAAAFNAISTGAVQLNDFVGQQSLKGILGGDASQYYASNFGK